VIVAGFDRARVGAGVGTEAGDGQAKRGRRSRPIERRSGHRSDRRKSEHPTGRPRRTARWIEPPAELYLRLHAGVAPSSSESQSLATGNLRTLRKKRGDLRANFRKISPSSKRQSSASSARENNGRTGRLRARRPTPSSDLRNGKPAGKDQLGHSPSVADGIGFGPEFRRRGLGSGGETQPWIFIEIDPLETRPDSSPSFVAGSRGPEAKLQPPVFTGTKTAAPRIGAGEIIPVFMTRRQVVRGRFL
jgi:hypothetical protein